MGIDRDPEFFFRPGTAAVVAAQSGFNMTEGDAGHCRGQCAPERARRVAMDNQQGGAVYQRQNRFRHCTDMRVRVFETTAIESDRGKPVEPEIGRIKLRMLARKYQRQRNAAGAQRLGNGGELDRFGTSADDEYNVRRQPSP